MGKNKKRYIKSGGRSKRMKGSQINLKLNKV